MTFVIDDTSVEIIGKMVRNSEAVLGKELASKLTAPVPSMAHENYFAQPVKVMVMGQETLGRGYALSDMSVDDPAWASQYKERELGEFALVNFGEGHSWSAKSHFWKSYQNVVDTFGMPSRKAVYWSNLVKLQVLPGLFDRESISQLGADAALKVTKWQRDLFLRDLEFAKPDVIVAFTGSMSWILRHSLCGPDERIEDVRSIHLGDDPKVFQHDHGIYKHPALGGAVLLATIHPAAIGKAAANRLSQQQLGYQYLMEHLQRA